MLDGTSRAVLTYRPDPDANSIAWLVWHLTRIQDDHVADVAGVEQRWTADGWYDRFGLPFPPEAHGYGHTSEEVGQVDVDGELLRRLLRRGARRDASATSPGCAPPISTASSTNGGTRRCRSACDS